MVPFIKNSKDNMHCVNAVFRMIHKHYFKKDLNWKEVDRVTKAIPGKGTWTFMGEMWLAKKGLRVLNIEPTDYKLLYKEGVEYLNKVVGKETAQYYLNSSNVGSVIKYIPEYLSTVKHFTRKSSIKEIIKFLKKGYLIGAEINSGILNNESEFDLHFILIYDFDGKNLIIHDPGLPPIKSRKVSLEEFNKCFNYPGSNSGIVVFQT
ncbi:hypothetical protein HY025_04430 [Candidatus Daviesbacteria bacterium]|nr:hypothetical protein [Candidatus Daviesbacteria bacterium]